MVEIENYDESETNNNDQLNEHTITVPDTQDVPNQVVEDVSNFVRNHFFFFIAKEQRKLPKEKTDYSF